MEQEPCLKGETKISPKIVTRSCSPKCTKFRMEGPDGGWAWVVAFAACIISFIMAGLGRMSGILYVAFIEWFGADRLSASAPFSIRSSTRNLLGPVVGILGQKYGVRLVTIVGGVMATLSASACFFAPDIIWMTVLWGVLNGVGAALSVTLPQVIVGQYFVKYTTTATGMAFSGGCFGAFLFPVLLEQLLREYGMNGTFLVLGAIIMHTIPAAMILKKPPWIKHSNSKNNNRDDTDCECETAALKESLLSENKAEDPNKIGEDLIKERRKSLSAIKDSPDIQFLRQNNATVLQILGKRTPMDNFLSLNLEINQNVSSSSREAYISKEIEEVYCRLQNFQRKLKFYHILRLFKNKRSDGALPKDDARCLSNQKSQSFQFALNSEFDMCDVYKASSVPDISQVQKKESRNYVMLKLKDLRELHSDIASRFPEEERGKVLKILIELRKLYYATAVFDDSIDRSEFGSYEDLDRHRRSVSGTNQQPASNTWWSHVLTALRLHRNPIFLLICLCRAVHFVTLVPLMTIIVDFIMDKGFLEEDGKYAIGVLSLGDLLGRLCFGWVTDSGYLSLARYMLWVMLLQGATTAALPFLQDKLVLYAGFIMFGLFQGTLFVRHNVLVSKYMDANEQSIAMGCMNFFSGLLGFGLPAYIGYFRDTVGTYDHIFYINGAFNFLTGVLWALEPYFLRCALPKVTVEGDSSTAV